MENVYFSKYFLTMVILAISEKLEKHFKNSETKFFDFKQDMF